MYIFVLRRFTSGSHVYALGVQPVYPENERNVAKWISECKARNATDNEISIYENTHSQDMIQLIPFTTEELADQTVENGIVLIAQSFTIKKIAVSSFCRLRLYKTEASRTSDAAREFGDTVYMGTQHMMIVDILLDDETGLTWEMSPDALGSNGNDPLTDEIYYAIQNLSGDDVTISVSLDVILRT